MCPPSKLSQFGSKEMPGRHAWLWCLRTLALAVPAPHAPAALADDETLRLFATAPAAAWELGPTAQVRWTCGAGQRNADASECLAAVLVATRGAANGRIKLLDSADDVPPGCSYSRVSSAAMFNAGAGQVGSDKGNYQLVCTALELPPCSRGPYVLDKIFHREGLGSTFQHRKHAFAYAAALNATYFGGNDGPGSLNAHLSSMGPRLPPIIDSHTGVDFGSFLGLGSDECSEEALLAYRETGGNHLSFVVSHGVENLHLLELCTHLENEQEAPWATDPLLQLVHTAVGGNLAALVLVFDGRNPAREDLNFCVFGPAFRQRFRIAQGIQAQEPLAIAEEGTRRIAVHFRWGDVATGDPNFPNVRAGSSLADFARVTNTVLNKIGGQVDFFSEGPEADFAEFTKAVPGARLHLGGTARETAEEAEETAEDAQEALLGLSQAHVLIGGSSSFFVLAAHLCEQCIVITDDWESAKFLRTLQP